MRSFNNMLEPLEIELILMTSIGLRSTENEPEKAFSFNLYQVRNVRETLTWKRSLNERREIYYVC